MNGVLHRVTVLGHFGPDWIELEWRLRRWSEIPSTTCTLYLTICYRYSYETALAHHVPQLIIPYAAIHTNHTHRTSRGPMSTALLLPAPSRNPFYAPLHISSANIPQAQVQTHHTLHNPTSALPADHPNSPVSQPSLAQKRNCIPPHTLPCGMHVIRDGGSQGRRQRLTALGMVAHVSGGRRKRRRRRVGSRCSAGVTAVSGRRRQMRISRVLGACGMMAALYPYGSETHY